MKSKSKVRKVKKVATALKKASRMHAKQAKTLTKLVKGR
jgi:hypothetical protein